jgi:hypothetical protein
MLNYLLPHLNHCHLLSHRYLLHCLLNHHFHHQCHCLNCRIL